MTSDLPNLLSASSILLAIITALFGLFYPAIKKILDIKPKKHSADNKSNYNLAKNTAKTKLLPLLIGSLIITTLFAPELIKQIKNSLAILFDNGFKNTTYDTLTASFIAVCVFMIFLTITIVRTGIKLKGQINKLKPEQ